MDPERPARDRGEADRFLRRFRQAWRRARLARAALLAAAVVLGGWALLAALDLLWPLPAALRSLLRFVPPAAGAAIVAAAAVRAGAVDRRRLALRAEEEHPALEAYLTTLLDAQPAGVVGDAFVARASARLAALHDSATVALHARAGSIATVSAAAALAAIIVLGGPTHVGQRWIRPADAAAAGARVASPFGARRAAADALRIERLRWTVTPPAYTGRPPERGADGGAIMALPGSRIRLEAAAPPPGLVLAARVVRGEQLVPLAMPAGGAEGRGWTGAWTLAAGERGVLLELLAADSVVARRVVPIVLHEDRPPEVQLLEPVEDMVVGSAAGTVRLRATARDDFGVQRFHLSWIHTSGSGESFSFRQGDWEWAVVRAAEGALLGEHLLDLATTELRPGDVLHVRAVAHDGNTVGGPGEGVSRTLVIRVARAEEAAEITTLIGFPLEAEQDPVLSQRMIILMTERLRDTRASLERAGLLAESNRIGDAQARLRGQVGDEVFVRLSADEHDEPLDESVHYHDEAQILTMNTLKLKAFNAMWAAERELRQGLPAEALPHQYEALDHMQQLREQTRVFVRGRQRVAPIDVAGARGTGRLSGAAPAARSGAPAVAHAAASAAELEALLAALHSTSAGELSVALAGLALRMLNEPAVDPRAAALVAEAGDAVLRGAHADAATLALRARALLAPAGATGAVPPVRAARSTVSAAYLERIGVRR